jgi:type IV pilus assembly protein PilW
LVADLRQTGSQYCASISNAQSNPQGGFPLRPLFVKTDVTLPWGLPSRATIAAPIPAVGEAWALSPRYFIQGHECSAGACDPALTVLGGALPVPPGTGTAANQRAAGADVLTVRYLSGPGADLAANHGFGATPLTLSVPVTPALTGGDLAMVADCRNAEVFSAVSGGTVVTPTGNGGGNNNLGLYETDMDARVFNFTQSFLTVTYFLRMRANSDGGASISTLVRQQNGQQMAISDGVERMEFLYGVRSNLADGTPQIRFMTAAQVQAGPPANCLTVPPKVLNNEVGCLWRQVESIDVALLMNTVVDSAPDANQRFSFSAATPALVDALPPALLPSGLPPGRMFRREFRTRVNVRSFTQ